MGFVFYVALFHFPRNLFLYSFTKVYSHEKLEVKQNETNKNLALHQGSLGGTALKEKKLLAECISLHGSCEIWTRWASQILQLGQWKCFNLGRRIWHSNHIFFKDLVYNKNGLLSLFVLPMPSVLMTTNP